MMNTIKQFVETITAKCVAPTITAAITLCRYVSWGPAARLMLSVKMDTTSVHRVPTLMMLAGGLSTPVQVV